MKKSILKAYAALIVRSGVNLQKGQDAVLFIDVHQDEFAAMIVNECYEAGAHKVTVRWTSEAVTKATYKKSPKTHIADVLPMDEAFQNYLTEKLPALIYIESDDPDGLKDLDPEKMSYVRRKNYERFHEIMEKRENKYQWCIAGVPSPAWAKKVFPNESKSRAIEKLWEAILETSRAQDGNGIENWEKHSADLKKRCDYLNSLRLKKLHYTSKNGTDLTVGLIPGVRFEGGSEKALGSGIVYEPNIPSEECFTSPMRGQAEGIVFASKPLSYMGTLIENFSVRFHEGKPIEVHAEKGEEALKSILTLDDGSANLGECALVPFHSPINDTGLLFYSTLYDENASCHLALGRGFTELYPDYEKYTEEQIHSFGINKSLSHVDFMIGTQDFHIVGTKEDGTEVEIFRDGEWAFKI